MALITAPPAMPTLAPRAPAATALMTFFLPDSAPSSLVASIIQVNTVGGDVTTSLVLDCPEATEPANDACRAAGIYPASAYHVRGLVWGGTTTVAADDSTTTWRCELGARITPGLIVTTVPGISAYCTRTVEAPGKARETVTTKYDHCYHVHHQLPVVVTAGGEKLAGWEYTLGMDADGINRALASQAKTISGCATATSLVFWKVPVGPGMLGSATSASTRAGGGGGGGGAQPTPTDGGLGGGSRGGAGSGAGGAGGGSGPAPGVTPTGSVVPSAGGRMLPPGLGLVKGAMAALALLAVLGV